MRGEPIHLLGNGNWSGAWNQMKGVVSNILNGIRSVISSVLNGIKGVISATMSGVLSIARIRSSSALIGSMPRLSIIVVSMQAA